MRPHVKSFEEVDAAAKELRKRWHLGDDAIPNLCEFLEEKGIKICALNLPDSVSGVQADVKMAGGKRIPVIVLNRNHAGERQRFTLAHELGHLMLEGRLADDLDEEMACNRFAGTFLFPRASVLQELGEHRNAIELKELGLLKEEFGLSMAGILYRARDLGIISHAYREEQAKLFRFKGWYRKEPGRDYPTEKAHIFEQLVFHALAEEYIGESKAAELMNMPLQQFRRVRSMEGGDAAVNQ